MVSITLPDGSKRTFDNPVTVAEVAASIGAGLAKALIRDICKQLDQDKVVWDRMRYEPNPIICEGDGPIAQFRKYYARYYVEGQGKPAPRAGS